MKIEDIRRLPSHEPSFVINKEGRRLESISAAYRDFVSQHSGVVARFFGVHSYRISLSADIEHGASWQLAMFIAHLLFANDRLNTHTLQSGDELIIATGKINVLSHEISAIEFLMQKTFRAQHHLSQLYPDAVLHSFFIPKDNYRQPLPDTQLNFTPLESLQAVFYFFYRLGVLSSPDSLVIEQGSAISEAPVQDSHVEASGATFDAVRTLSMPTKLIIFAMLMVTLSLSYFILFNEQSEIIEKRVGLNACISPEAKASSFALENGLHLPLTYSAGLCAIEFSLPSRIKAVFALTQTGLVVQLSKASNGHWRLDKPSRQHLPLQYRLVLSDQAISDVDFTQISAIVNQDAEPSELMALLQTWAKQNNHTFIFLHHQFV